MELRLLKDDESANTRSRAPIIKKKEEVKKKSKPWMPSVIHNAKKGNYTDLVVNMLIWGFLIVVVVFGFYMTYKRFCNLGRRKDLVI